MDGDAITKVMYPSMSFLNHVCSTPVPVLVVFCFIRVLEAANLIETSRHPSPQIPPPASPGGAQGFPKSPEKHSLSSVSWAVPWASSPCNVPGTPTGGSVQEKCTDS
ncbi:hypothetical protein XENOCAPTIV_026881 [Xenoophorus captivus]|uniref:Uncharacterized protein n=1 Tax=Xenoophorus captivus TaxID=1517983 RepID=A0ABV0SBT0_9TELE